MISGTSKIVIFYGPLPPLFYHHSLQKIQEILESPQKKITVSYVNFLELQNVDIFGPTKPPTYFDIFVSYFEICPPIKSSCPIVFGPEFLKVNNEKCWCLAVSKMLENVESQNVEIWKDTIFWDDPLFFLYFWKWTGNEKEG